MKLFHQGIVALFYSIFHKRDELHLEALNCAFEIVYINQPALLKRDSIFIKLHDMMDLLNVYDNILKLDR